MTTQLIYTVTDRKYLVEYQVFPQKKVFVTTDKITKVMIILKKLKKQTNEQQNH